MVYGIKALVCVSQRYCSHELIAAHEYNFGLWFDNEPRPDELHLYARLSYLDKLQQEGALERAPLHGEEWVIEAAVMESVPRHPGKTTDYLPAYKEAILRKYQQEQSDDAHR